MKQVPFDVIVLAGGASSRFVPFNSKSKALFLLAGKPIIRHTLDNLHSFGVKEVTIVADKRTDISTIMNDLSMNIRRVVQIKPNGQADALLVAWKTMSRRHPVLVLNAQHFTASTVVPAMIELYEKTGKSVILSTKTATPEKYGIIGIEGQKITHIVEKPKAGAEPSTLRIVGIYLLTPDVIEIIKSLRVSQYQLEEGLELAAKKGKLVYRETKQETPSLKYPWDILKVKDLLLGDKQIIDKTAFIHKTALLEGPCWIGPKAIVGAYCILRKGVILESGAEIQRYVEVKNSVIGKNSHIHSGYIGDSILGENCRIGAGFTTANRRFDRKSVRVEIKGEKVDCGSASLGVMMGDGVKVGIRAGTMPGTIIFPGSVLKPGEMAKGVVSAVQ